MGPSLALTILGVAVTVVFGVWGIAVAIKYSRSVRITFVFESAIALLSDVTQGIENLEVQFRGFPVSQNIVLIKGGFMNSGRRDITPDLVEKQLSLTLPEGFEWLECRLLDRSADLDFFVQGIESQSVQFGHGLWKTGEYVRLSALAAVPNGLLGKRSAPGDLTKSIFFRNLRVDCRVADLKEVERVDEASLLFDDFSFEALVRDVRSGESVFGFLSHWLMKTIRHPLTLGLAVLFVSSVGLIDTDEFSGLFSHSVSAPLEVSAVRRVEGTAGSRVGQPTVEVGVEELPGSPGLPGAPELCPGPKPAKYMLALNLLMGFILVSIGVRRVVRTRSYRGYFVEYPGRTEHES